MAKFIKLTDRKRGEVFVLNADTIEYMLPIPNDGGTSIISVTHHTKYDVRESLDDILQAIGCDLVECRDAKETLSVMEVKENGESSI